MSIRGSLWRRLQNAGALYSRLNAEHPRKLNCFMAFWIATIGDYGCQRFLHNLKEKDSDGELGEMEFAWDMKRTLDMGIVRSSLVAPFLFAWYRFLSTIMFGGKFANLFGRLLIDQSIGGPTVISLVFFGNHLLQWPNFSIPQFLDNLREKGPSTWKTGLSYNPFVMCMNFAFVPLRHQALVAHFTAIYWTAVLSYYSNMNLR